MSSSENPYAGQGPVLLDIGDDVGALIVHMPPESVGLEVEIRPRDLPATPEPAAHEHGHAGSHDRGHATHDHASHGHGHDHGPAGHQHPHFPHVAVVPRQLGDRIVPSLVYPEVVEGAYRLFPIPAQQPTFDVEVTAGAVTELSWDLPVAAVSAATANVPG